MIAPIFKFNKTKCTFRFAINKNNLIAYILINNLTVKVASENNIFKYVVQLHIL